MAPWNSQCDGYNYTHLVLEVKMNGAVYRMVVNVHSTWASDPDPRVSFLQKEAALVGGPWSEGWRTGMALEYGQTLQVKRADFVPREMKELISRIDQSPEIPKISGYRASRSTTLATAPHLA